jgi:hypothetical protein
VIRALPILALALVLPAIAAERAAQGTLLKPPPSRGGDPAKPAPPAGTPAPSAITTPRIQLIGFTGNKDGPQLPAQVATPALRLWGAP